MQSSHAAHRVRPASQAGRTLWAAVLLAMAPAIAAAQGGTSSAPVRYTPLDNQVMATYVHDGIIDTSFAGATITVARQAALSLTGSTTASLAPGQRRSFPHLLTNRGTADDLVSLVATTSAGWTVALYRDVDGNGQLSAADVPVASPIALAVGANVALLAVLDVPAGAPLGATSDVTLAATSGADPRAVATAADRVTVIAKPLPDLRLAKVVDRAAATLGDTLHYTISFSNVGDGDAKLVSLADTLPLGLRYLAGSLRLDGAALTDTADTDAGVADTIAGGRTVVRVALGTLVAQASGSLTLSAVVASTTLNPTIANVAVLASGDSARTYLASGAQGAVTHVSPATLTLSDRLVGTPILMAGAQVHLRLTWGNTATVPAKNAVLVDTLPAALSVENPDGGVVTTTGGATPQAIVTWTLGTLAVGATGTHDIYLRVTATPTAGDISDRASITADNAATQLAAVRASLALFTATDLHITKTAAVLEAAIGDAVPYTVVVRNAGVAALSGVVVHDLLPEGMRYVPRSLSGADSATVQGSTLSLYVGAPLAAGASISVRYAAVVATPAPGASLENLATAEAESGLVYSDTARAVVSQRRTLAMRERTMIGKVWLDRNDDGAQEAGEEGVAGVQVWDANGDFAVTDKEGRFSFRNVATGTHALRLDPAGIPRNFVLPTRADEVVLVKADGWSLPSTSIRLVPRANAVAAASCGCAPGTVTLAGAPAAAAPTATAVVAAPAIAAPVVAPLLTAAARAAIVRRELIEGAGLHIAAPMDGTVLANPRFFANVRGVPGAQVALYDGATPLVTGTLRGDGVQDFVNVELAAGPHHLRVAAVDSATGLRADSIMVHVSGAPSHFVVPAELPALHRDSREPVLARVQVLDRWNVPVANRPMVTVAVTGATVAAGDEDASSVGLQLRADASGWVTVPLKAGFQIGGGELRLSASDARSTVPLQIFASVRPLAVTGVGQLGLGAAPGSFGAVAVQGAIAENTSLLVSYDSRRGAAADFFNRGFDPLGDEQVPVVGDNSTSGGIAPTTKTISARVEHGMDWLAAGDVQTLGFGRAGELGAYRRSLTGVSAQLGTGNVVWHGFGSMTQQSVERTQLRGDGSTGPYLVGSAIRPGTEAIAIEVRSRDNAARVVTQQVLGRVTDYQIDYATGAVLLRLPVPSADSYGNPVYVVATVERMSGGAAHFVGGLRADLDAARVLRLDGRLLDSLTLGLSGVRDEAAVAGSALGGVAGASTLVNADLRLRRGGLSLAAGLLHSLVADSSGLAASATARWALPDDALVFDGQWMSVGQGMGSTDPRLASALMQTDFGLTGKLSATSLLRMRHSESRFLQYGITRATTSLGAEETLSGRKLKQDVSLLSESGGTAGLSSSLTARLSTSLSNTVETWVDGTHSLETPVTGVSSGRPNQVGTGVTIQLPASLKLEASHRIMRTPGDSVVFGVTSAQLRAESILGGQVWTGFEESTAGLHDEVRAGHSALLGWNQKLGLGAGWQLTSLYERRIGLSRASIAEPERALPFVQEEKDRWSAGLGLGWMPGGDAARLTVNGEMQRGQGIQSSRFQLSGDAAINAGLAVLALNDWAGRSDAALAGGAESRQDRSLLGLAMRPVTSNQVNILSKLEWRRTTTPGNATLLTSASRDLRLIASSDLVWTPTRRTELSTRYALRATTSDVAGDSTQRLHLADHFAGARMEQRIFGALHVRADARMLLETESHTALWNVAPSVTYDVQGRLVLEAGYRFGALRDPDFAAVGGAGAFATVGFRFTEGSLANPASFWRERIANDR